MKTLLLIATLLLALPALAQIAPPPLDDYQAVGISRDGSQGMLVNLKDVSVEGHVVGFVTILAGIKGRDPNGTYVFNPRSSSSTKPAITATPGNIGCSPDMDSGTAWKYQRNTTRQQN
jgi:hypothetical protein